MNTRRCLRIAERIDLLVRREIGIGVDPQRMVLDPLYARDVLLVCDAQRGSDLEALAQHFRVAAHEDADERALPSHWGASSTPGAGFAPSSRVSGSSAPSASSAPSSLHGALPTSPSRFGSTAAARPASAAERARAWFSPYRWTDPRG